MRFLVPALLLFAAVLAVPGSAAAASCQLSTNVSPGHSITVTGSGFGPNETVDIKQVWSGSNATAGGATGPQTTTSNMTADAAGGFVLTLDAGPGHGGTYDFTATSPSCSATAQAVAVETAGGVRGGTNPGGQATPPPTATAPIGDRGQATAASMAIVGLIAGFMILGLAVLRWRLRRG